MESTYPHQIKELRTGLGETQEGFARLLGVSTSIVAKWEAGASRPSGKHALAIQRLRGRAPQSPRQAPNVATTIGTYDQAIATWEADRDERIRAGESTATADSVLRVLRATRDRLLRTATDA